MSIDHESMLMVGWKIEKEPDFWHEDETKIYGTDWKSLDSLADSYTKITGCKHFCGEDFVCEVDSICCDKGYVVGVPLNDMQPITISDFVQTLYSVQFLAEEVWREIMRSEPPSKPFFMNFVCTY